MNSIIKKLHENLEHGKVSVKELEQLIHHWEHITEGDYQHITRSVRGTNCFNVPTLEDQRQSIRKALEDHKKYIADAAELIAMYDKENGK